MIAALKQGLHTIFELPVEVYSKKFLQELAGSRMGKLYKYDVQHLQLLMPLLAEASKVDSDQNSSGG